MSQTRTPNRFPIHLTLALAGLAVAVAAVVPDASSPGAPTPPGTRLAAAGHPGPTATAGRRPRVPQALGSAVFEVPPARGLSHPSAQPLRTDALRVYALRSYARASKRDTSQPRPSAQRTSGLSPAAASSSTSASSKAAVSSGAALSSGTAASSGTASGGQPRQIARALLSQFHWQAGQFTYLNLLWAKESGWNPRAVNPNSGAYGIPQAVPGSKMASAGPDWRTDARTQIVWGMRYIQARYGTPYRAWQHEQDSGWY